MVAKEEAEATIQQQEASELAAEAQAQVAEANILLNETLEEVKKLEIKNLVELKSMNNPPDACKCTLGGVVMLTMDYIKEQGGAMIMMPDPDPKAYGKKIDDYFNTAKKYLLAEPQKLLDLLLKQYNKENINP